MVLQFIVNGFITGCGYIMIAIGLTLVFGILNIVNIAHGVFYSLGSYMFYTWVNTIGLGMLPSITVTLIALGIIAVVVERLIYKPLRNKDHTMQIIAANGFAILLIDLIRVIWGADSFRIKTPWMSTLVTIGPISLTVQRIMIVVGAIISVTLVMLLIKKTKLGLMMRALPDDNIAAKLNGININLVSAVTFAIAASIAALGAATMGPVFTVEAAIGDTMGNKAFAAVIAGGMGSIPGTAIAAMGMGIIESFVSGYIATGYENLITFAILILVLIFKPTGIMGKKRSI